MQLQERPLNTDYLVVGAGATAMSFVDTLLDDTEAHVLMVDRHVRPGGHWNDAYPFVRLHQPTIWYGVPSRPLADSTGAERAASGDDRGATGSEILEYFNQLMLERFLPSGRVQWMAESEYVGRNGRTHRIRSMVTGEVHDVVVRKKLVDATLTRTEVPSTHPPRYRIDHTQTCVSPNVLAELVGKFEHFTVIGGGKTAMDACLFLLDNFVSPDRIRWIIPRDAWLMARGHMLPGPEHFATSLRGFMAHYEAIATAPSIEELFLQLEDRGVMLRLDRNVRPQKVRGAVSSPREMERLRSIPDIVRRGRVVAIDAHRVVMVDGELPTHQRELFVDCSASAAVTPHNLPVFEGEQIRLLTLLWGQPMLSASLIAHVEATMNDNEAMNAICQPVVSPVTVEDWLPMWATTLANANSCRKHPALHSWMRDCRLHVPTMLTRGVDAGSQELQVLMKEMSGKVTAAAMRLRELA